MHCRFSLLLKSFYMIRRNVLCLFWHSCSDNSLIIVAVNLAKLINLFRLLLCICPLVSFNDKSFRTPFRQTGLHCSKMCASIFFKNIHYQIASPLVCLISWWRNVFRPKWKCFSFQYGGLQGQNASWGFPELLIAAPS